MSSSKTFLIFSQTFVPDPAAVGQQMADAAFEMARRGHRVVVYAAARGYDDPSLKYPAREVINGVVIRRLKFSSFGKQSLLKRVFGTATFLLQCIWLGLTTPNVGAIFFSTSPPMIGAAAAIARVLRGIPIIYWAMDLNPDQLIAMGKVSGDGLIARVLERANRFILRHCSLVIALDRFMAERLRPRAHLEGRMLVLPPWPHEQFIAPIAHEENPFRQKHRLEGKFVVMYSGNHSSANPLDTVLEAAVRLKGEEEIRFLFVGGGTGKKAVDAFIRDHHLENALSLPYQPMGELRYSLSAADVHVVTLGDNMVGIVHPCKIYGAMAASRPVLFVGPKPSHVSDLLDRYDFGLRVAHGDVEGAVAAIRSLRDAGAEGRREMGELARRALRGGLSQRQLSGRLCEALERVLSGEHTIGPPCVEYSG